MNMYLLIYLQLYLTLPLLFQLSSSLFVCISIHFSVSLKFAVFSSQTPQLPFLSLTSLCQVSVWCLQLGICLCWGSSFICDAFGFHLNAAVCILFILLYLISWSQCDHLKDYQWGRAGMIFLVCHHPLHVCRPSSISTHLWMDILVFYNAWLFQGAPQETLQFRCDGEGSFSLDSSPGVLWFGDLLVGAFFAFEEICRVCLQQDC